MDKRLDAPLSSLSRSPTGTDQQGTWRPIHYLGSKLRLLGPLKDAIRSVGGETDDICDLFAGSGTVAAALASEHNVIASDIQEYSRVLCSAILNPCDLNPQIVDDIWSNGFNYELARRLEWAAPLIEYEETCLGLAKAGQAEAISDLIEHGSLVTLNRPANIDGRRAQDQVWQQLNTPEAKQGSIVLRHFGGLYFSYRQAAHLDALLACAHRSSPPLKETLLAIALSGASELVNTVGKQFAQPIQPRDVSGQPKHHLVSKIIRDRELDASDVLAKWMRRYQAVEQNSRAHRVIRADYADALAEIKGKVGVVYADPPYTREHYSRFYHVLETMCRTEDPSLSTTRIRASEPRISRAVYRADRHQSPFCIRSKAPEAFNALFGGVKEAGARLVLSYSPYQAAGEAHPRVMTIEQIVGIARLHFSQVEVNSAGRLSHSKLNSSQHHLNAADEAELIICCS